MFLPNIPSHLSPPYCSLELLPMTSYFSDIVKDLKNRTEIATNALMESEETAEVSFWLKDCHYLQACILSFGLQGKSRDKAFGSLPRIGLISFIRAEEYRPFRDIFVEMPMRKKWDGLKCSRNSSKEIQNHACFA